MQNGFNMEQSIREKNMIYQISHYLIYQVIGGVQNMTHGSIKLTQKDNKVQGSYEKLGMEMEQLLIIELFGSGEIVL